MRNIARTLAVAGFIFMRPCRRFAQDTSTEHVRALIATGDEPAGGRAGPGRRPAGDSGDRPGHPLERGRSGGARHGQEPHDRLRAADAADVGSVDRGDARVLPAQPHLGLRQQQPDEPDVERLRGGRHDERRRRRAGPAALAQNMWRGGGNYTVNWTNSRNDSDSNNTTVNPALQLAGCRRSFTQPLLRNFKIDNTRAILLSNEINQQISEINLSATVASTVAAVRNAYWELVYALQAVEAAQRSLELASKLVQDNRSRVEIGTMAPIDVVQAQAEQATRRQTAGERPGDAAQQRAGAQAPDRQRHRGRAVARDASPDRAAGDVRRGRSTSKGRWRTRWPTAPTSRARARTSS